MAINVYCDESCHLENDKQQVMVVGAISCPSEHSRTIAKNIKSIKKKHSLSKKLEIKWAKVSPAKIDFYMDLLQYFFDEDKLNFRALIIPDKQNLSLVEHDYNTWHYRMHFEMLKGLFCPDKRYRIYLDIKDDLSSKKLASLQNLTYDNNVDRLQSVRSCDIEQMQLLDLLIGCVLYDNKYSQESDAKRALVEKMRGFYGNCLTNTTFNQEGKINLLCWRVSEEEVDGGRIS